MSKQKQSTPNCFPSFKSQPFPPFTELEAQQKTTRKSEHKAMDSEHQQYSVDDEIAAFFSKTAVTRHTCDGLAKDLVGGDQVVPVAVQGVCSYTVYAGPGLDHVVQFCLLVGVIDWAEAEIGPFGTNLHSLQDLMSKFHLKHGWIRYDDYDELVSTFWKTLSDEVGGLDEDKTKAIRAARVLGLLRSWAFTSRLANEPAPVPIKDDETGRYRMRIIDGLLINPTTRFEGMDEWLE